MGFNFAEFVDQIGPKTSPKVIELRGCSDDYSEYDDNDLFELYSERAAFGEFGGGTELEEAEAAALDWLKTEIGESRFKVWSSKPNNV